MAEITHINNESDFDFVLRAVSNDIKVDITKDDFKLVFFTDGKTNYECSKTGGVLTNISIEGEDIRCIFDNHGLGCGALKFKMYQNVANELYPDGYKLTVTPQELPIILWQGKSDDTPTLNVDFFVSRLEYMQEVITKIKDSLTWK